MDELIQYRNNAGVFNLLNDKKSKKKKHEIKHPVYQLIFVDS